MINSMTITAVQYTNNDNCIIKATIDGQKMFVPLDPANRHYAEILRQVEAGTITIAAAD